MKGTNALESWDDDCIRRERKSVQTWQMVDVLNDRVLGLNNLMEQSKQVCEEILTSPSDSNHKHCSGSNEIEVEDFFPELKVESNDDVISIPQSLAFRDPNLPYTEAGRKIELLFQKYHDNEGNETERKGRKKARRGAGRLDIEKQERRRKAIMHIQTQLEKNSEKYVTRAANSLHFRVQFCNGDDHSITSPLNTDVDPRQEKWPIELGGFDMNPQLLLKLSIEKAIIPNGLVLMKRLVLNEISCDLFVYIFWFVHCRFFQVRSHREQRYLMGKIALIYPGLITLMTSLAPTSKTKDFLHRCYPFILSKAIYLGFRYLCPGNHNLFKGAFHRVLHLSVFCLLTGVDIGPGSVDILCRILYPDDDVIDYSKRINDDNKCPQQEKMGKIRSTVVRGRKPANNGDVQMLSRQQQINFDANQISPLLLKCLQNTCDNIKEHQNGNDSSSNFRKKQIIKHTKPVRWCRTGGLETMPEYCNIKGTVYRSGNPSKSTCSTREKIMQDHVRAQKEHSSQSNEDRNKCIQRKREIEKERNRVIGGGSNVIAGYSSLIEQKSYDNME